MSEKLNVLIEREKKNIETLENRKVEIEEKLKKSKAKLQELEMMANSEKFNAFSAVVMQSGLSLDDVMAALQGGDLLSLQEQLEAARKPQVNEAGIENNKFVGENL